jgi:hypothetical protein
MENINKKILLAEDEFWGGSKKLFNANDFSCFSKERNGR